MIKHSIVDELSAEADKDFFNNNLDCLFESWLTHEETSQTTVAERANVLHFYKLMKKLYSLF